MESLLESFKSLFPQRPGSQSNTYERSEESHYVYKLHPDGKGATVATSVSGNYRTPSKTTGEMAGLFAGELDAFGNLKEGGFQKITREGDKETHDIRGTLDPAILAEKIGISKPKFLATKPFDLKLAAKPLAIDEAEKIVDELLSPDLFQTDPFLEPKVIQTSSPCGALGGL